MFHRLMKFRNLSFYQFFNFINTCEFYHKIRYSIFKKRVIYFRNFIDRKKLTRKLRKEFKHYDEL